MVDLALDLERLQAELRGLKWPETMLTLLENIEHYCIRFIAQHMNEILNQHFYMQNQVMYVSRTVFQSNMYVFTFCCSEFCF